MTTLTRRHLIATALTLPALARAQTPPDKPRVLEARTGSLRLLPEPAAETPVWGYDGLVPSPLLRVKKGEELRLTLLNKLDQPTSLHWHGVRLPNEMDGVAGVTQKPVPPGGTFDVRFTPPDAGTFWYRPGAAPFVAEQAGRGLHGLLIVDEPQPPVVDRDIAIVIDDWRLDEKGAQGGFLDPADMAGEGRIGGLVTVNGRTLPVEESFQPGARLRLRLLNACNARLVGLIFEKMQPVVVAVDGQPSDLFSPARQILPIGPGARFDVIVDLPADTGTQAALLLRGGGLKENTQGEPDRRLVTFRTEGKPREALPAIAALPPNPLLPTEIKLQNARRVDLLIDGPAKDPAADPRKIWTLSGVAGSPEAKPFLLVPRGQPVSLGFVNRTPVVHTLHLHGHVMRVLHNLDDGWEPYWRDMVVVPPGRTVRVAFVADNPGRWLVESTILEHAMSGLWGWFEVR